jgi:hypothetical protein
MNGGSVTITSAFGEFFSMFARLTTSPLPAVTMLTTRLPSSRTPAARRDRGSRDRPPYSTTAFAACAGSAALAAARPRTRPVQLAERAGSGARGILQCHLTSP